MTRARDGRHQEAPIRRRSAYQYAPLIVYESLDFSSLVSTLSSLSHGRTTARGSARRARSRYRRRQGIRLLASQRGREYLAAHHADISSALAAPVAWSPRRHYHASFHFHARPCRTPQADSLGFPAALSRLDRFSPRRFDDGQPFFYFSSIYFIKLLLSLIRRLAGGQRVSRRRRIYFRARARRPPTLMPPLDAARHAVAAAELRFSADFPAARRHQPSRRCRHMTNYASNSASGKRCAKWASSAREGNSQTVFYARHLLRLAHSPA